MLRRVLIANRGEIAVRIARSCRELGIASVAVHADPDADALHVRTADEAVALPGSSPRDTYLSIDALVAAAIASGADAVHPGYGFLAESADFARAVTEAELTFVGPPAAAIAALGDKVRARELARRADVPLVPGTGARGSRAAIGPGDAGAADGAPAIGVADVVAFGDEHGWPVAVKAVHGGGGRGMRIADDAAGAAGALESARREAAAAFGDHTVYLERYLERPRHVEVQIVADGHGNVVWLGDRDCSVQRRHQKLIEEAPAPDLPDEMRTAMGDAAVRLARLAGYEGAGTVEFLVVDGAFHFLEMNTRIQVEHPVTEAVLGIDLIHEQLRVAGGEPLSITTSGPEPRGHAVECRINAEDAGLGFVPVPGRIDAVAVPSRPGLRWDAGYGAGDEVSVHYDSLLGKLVAWAPTRTLAIARLHDALTDLRIDGVPTTARVAAATLTHEDFRTGPVHTGWFEEHADALVPDPGDGSDGPGGTAGAARADGSAGADGLAGRATGTSDGAIPGPEAVMIGGRPVLVPAANPRTASAEGPLLPATRPSPAGPSSVAHPSTRPAPREGRPARPASQPGSADGVVCSPMHGTVLAVRVELGDMVPSGAPLVTVEAMKMENHVVAPHDGRIVEIHVTEGTAVASGDPLVCIAAPGT